MNTPPVSLSSPDEENMLIVESTTPQGNLLSSAASTNVILNGISSTQLGYVVVTNVDMSGLSNSNEEQVNNSDLCVQLEKVVPSVAGDTQSDREASESEHQGLPRKRAQTNSETNQNEKRCNSIEATPKKARQSVKSNSSTPNRRPRSKSESGTSSDAFDSFSVEETLRHLSGSVTPETTDASIKNAPVSSMLEDVLTEKKLALLRSPEVIQFLQKQQVQKARESRLAMGSNQRADNS